ncbi:TetR/AcrR family transcriptional regulator C-terminal domain-containing protein [Paenibacillus sp. MMS18-CY102]|uniref:TetR/AcrR family transcriptional regulator C-terminal domain-containing protein n=1 Tax=Paenibacillus sp. MMS18-CY102 TaxID=2682849 RepID=UPI00136555C5|nr:TetR/AcrR family transcriptional regulator C-terminal domain-containing protein [Paenibacillus sp. MMS18-CY102]MWC28846.1 TetR family transcriptional regulator [Paenibacillus sp. MMS18-CY102]
MARRRIYPTSESIPLAGQQEPLHTPLDRDRIINIALELLQSESLANISMRRIADALGVKAAALYYHVKDKEQLLHGLAEQISKQIPFPDASLAWREQLAQWASNFRHTLNQYRDAVTIMGATIAGSPSRLAHIEYLYRVLSQAGFLDAHVPWLAAMIKNFIMGFADEERRLQSRASDKGETMEAMSATYADRFQSLPQDQYPHVIRLAAITTAPDLDAEFAFGLNVLFDGFEASRQ